MNLDDLTVAIRPRRGHESVDLGLRLARTNAWALWGAFVPVFLLVSAGVIALLHENTFLVVLVIWWLKPMFDRIALFVLSRSVFGARPRVRDTWRALPSLYRRGAVAGQLHRRLDAARSLNLAVWQLEEQRGRDGRNRVRLIETPVRHTAGWLTVTCLLFEGVLMVSLMMLAYWLIPPPLLDPVDLWLAGLGEFETLFEWACILSWLVAVAIVEPFYVAGGFALYLNRRTQLEAWDIEIAFRRMQQRLQAIKERAA